MGWKNLNPPISAIHSIKLDLSKFVIGIIFLDSNPSCFTVHAQQLQISSVFFCPVQSLLTSFAKEIGKNLLRAPNPANTMEFMVKKCTYIYSGGSSRVRTRGVSYQKIISPKRDHFWQEFWQGGVRDPKLSAAQKQVRSFSRTQKRHVSRKFAKHQKSGNKKKGVYNSLTHFELVNF